ncbi:MAG: amidohydrolase [Planctomyces sp.]|nr:amidohydrolase [Planctomyces sp.]
MKNLVLICLTLVFFTSSIAAQPPDVIFTGGRIVTVDQQFTIATALAIRGDRIVLAGSDSDVQKLAVPTTRKIDLLGKMILPGLIDSHVHATGAAVYEFDHPIPEMETITDVLEYVRRRADSLEDGQWILLNQVFVTRLRDQRFPTRWELDEVAPNNPVAFRTGPDAALNSLALKLCGIDKDFRITDGQPGRIETDPETGEPNGIIRSAGRFIKTDNPDRNPDATQQKEALRKLLADYNASGITSIVQRSADESAVQLFQSLLDDKQLTCRTFLCWGINPTGEWKDVSEQILTAARHPAHEYNNMLWVRGVKVFLDGGMLTGSAYMRKPWGVSTIYSINDPDYRGVLNIEPERLFEVARLCLQNDLQITAHAVGDGAVHTLIDAYRRVNEELPVKDRRPCITHCNFMSEEAIESMKQLGIVADIQPVWLYLDGKTLHRQFGNERLTWFQPYKTLFEEGVMVGGGSDHMQKIGSLRSVNPYNPFLGLWTMLTRLPRWTDQPLHPEQIVTREQALRFYTINNAWLTFEEHEKGSLEAGKLADFIVIDRDYLTCPVDEIRSITVEQTWLGGQVVYEKSQPE